MDTANMQTTWYLSPGQTIDNTKIEDRGHALNVTEKGWARITKHLDRNRLIKEAIEKEQAHRAALFKGSKDMTKDWDNSVENKRRCQEEERDARLKKERDEKMESFFKLRDQQQAIREKYIRDARKASFISKGPPKSLTNALILSEVIYQREKQLELEHKIQEHEKEEAAKYAQKIKAGAEQEKLENLEKARKMHEKSIELRNIYLNEMREREETRITLKETSIRKERLDIINSKKESEQIKQIKKEEDQRKRATAKLEFSDFWEQQKKTKELMDQEEQEQNLVIDIYSKAKHGIECLRNKKLQEMQRALQQRREAASRQATAQAAAKSANEEWLMKKAQEERDKEEEEKLLAKAAYKEQLIKDRNADRAAFMKREEIRKYEEAEMQKWEMLNRFKANDVTQQYEIDRKNKQWQATLKYRRDLFEQMEENEEERRKVKEEADQLFKRAQAKFDEEDKQFFEYANEVYTHAKNRNRRTFPIERVVEEYRKENNLPRNTQKICENYEVQNSKNGSKTSK